MSSLIQAAAVIGAFASTVAAHGRVIEVVADGVWYQGYDPNFQYQQSPPTVIGWTAPETQDNGFVAPDAYADPNIICHKGATPGGTSAKVAAGGSVSLFWSVWPDSHHGPVIDYLANCNGDCTSVDKESLAFFKINQGGVVDGSTAPGTWATDELIANNNTWEVTIPTNIAPGNYVLRHEIIALHSAGQENGAQNYPQCINLEITGAGTDAPSGVAGTALYKSTDPGIVFNIYTAPIDYTVPGPALISEGGAGQQPGGDASSVTPAPTSIPTTAAVTSVIVADATSISTLTPTPSAVVPTAAVSQIDTLPTAIPSDLLTSPLPAIPTPTPGSGVPASPLPEGVTLKDLLEWLSYALHKYFKHGGNSNHARDLSGER